MVDLKDIDPLLAPLLTTTQQICGATLAVGGRVVTYCGDHPGHERFGRPHRAVGYTKETQVIMSWGPRTDGKRD